MKRVVVPLILLALAAVVLVLGIYAWQNRPGRPVLSVNGRVLTAQELDQRAEALLADAKRDDHLVVPPAREAEALEHYRRRAAWAWTVKQILLAGAVARGLEATHGDERESMNEASTLLRKRRGITIDDYFNEGPLPAELKRRDFREGVLVDKFRRQEVLDKIHVTGQEARERIERNQKLNLMSGGKTPPLPTKLKQVIDSLRQERFDHDFQLAFKSLFNMVTISSPLYPEFEKLEGLVSSKGMKK